MAGIGVVVNPRAAGNRGRPDTAAHLAAVVGGAGALAVAAILVFRAGLRRYESGSRFGSLS